MPQNPGQVSIANNTTGAAVQVGVDAVGNMNVNSGGTTVTKNVAAAAVIKTGPGRVAKIINNAGVAGFTLSDLAATSGAAAANQLYVITTTTVGQIITLDLPFTTGLAVTTLGASGNLVVVYQ